MSERINSKLWRTIDARSTSRRRQYPGLGFNSHNCTCYFRRYLWWVYGRRRGMLRMASGGSRWRRNPPQITREDAIVFRVNVRSVGGLVAVTTIVPDSRLPRIAIREIKGEPVSWRYHSFSPSGKIVQRGIRRGGACAGAHRRPTAEPADIFSSPDFQPTVCLHLWELPSRSQLAVISLFFPEALSRIRRYWRRIIPRTW